MQLPRGIDWSKLEYRFDPPSRASAYWGDVCVAEALTQDGNRERLVSLLADAVYASLHRDAQRPAGAVGNPDECLAGFAAELGVKYEKRA